MQKKTCSILTENCLILTFRDLSAICFHRIVLFYNHLRHSYRLISLFFQLWMQQRYHFSGIFSFCVEAENLTVPERMGL